MRKPLIYDNIFKTNNNGFTIYDGKLKKISKYKYSKIQYFNKYDPEISLYKNNLIFFDNKGTILNFQENSKLLWKKNYYSKIERKKNPILFIFPANFSDRIFNSFAACRVSARLKKFPWHFH